MEKKAFFKKLEEQRRLIEDNKYSDVPVEVMSNEMFKYNVMLKFAYYYLDFPTMLTKQENFELVENAVAVNGYQIKKTSYTSLVLVSKPNENVCSHLVNFNFDNANEVSGKLYEFGDDVVKCYEDSLITMAYNSYKGVTKETQTNREMQFWERPALFFYKNF